MAGESVSGKRRHGSPSGHPPTNPVTLLEAGFDMAYQPIVQLASGAVIAYEALARPRHTEVRHPQEFFAALAGAGMHVAAERAALRKAIEGASERPRRTKLFVNASPSTLADLALDVDELLRLVETHVVAPSDLVIEVTESEAVDDLDALAARVTKLRRRGIGLAVDDAGAGHASFRVITRLRPSYIKLDRDLVAGVDTDGARHAFIDAILRFARQIGSRLIAEGIETDGELVSLAGLGVEAGQGYFLARPAIGEFVRPSAESRRSIAATAQRLRLGAARVTAGELARPAAVVQPDLTIRDAFARFLAEPSLGVLVMTDPDAEHPRLVGQVSRRMLERTLAAPEAWSWFSNRTLGDVADAHPLTIMSSTDLVETAAIIGARQRPEMVDDVLVTDVRGDLVGVVAVRDVIRALAEVRSRSEGDFDPLSGLLGAGWMESELSRRLQGEAAVSVLFVDLDQFKLVNNLAGYPGGDEVIRVFARCLTGVAASIDDVVVTHAGADDFLLLVDPQHYEELLGELVRTVEAEVMPLVRTLLRMGGSGDEGQHVALSVGAVDLAGGPPRGHSYVDWAANLAAPLVQTAKGHADHASVHRSGSVIDLSTWTCDRDERLVVSVGRAEPSVVLDALALIDSSFDRWLAETKTDSTSLSPAGRFPGPKEEMSRLCDRYLDPLRTRAVRARRQGETVIDVRLEGDEDELLALLDRIAYVTPTHASRRLPVPADVALIDRLLRQRARTLTRQDRRSEMEPGARVQGPADDG